VPTENGSRLGKNGSSPENRKHRFGIEKPAIPGPGRPPIPFDIKQERKAIQEAIVKATPEAIARLKKALGSDDERNAIRASEVLLSHSVPKLDEGVITLEHTPLANLPDNSVTEILSNALAGTTPIVKHNGNGRNGATA
jgi:hypothetical protein